METLAGGNDPPIHVHDEIYSSGTSSGTSEDADIQNQCGSGAAVVPGRNGVASNSGTRQESSPEHLPPKSKEILSSGQKPKSKCGKASHLSMLLIMASIVVLFGCFWFVKSSGGVKLKKNCLFLHQINHPFTLLSEMHH